MTIIARAGWAARANSASRSPPAGSGARFRRHSLAIPAARRPRHCQAHDHGTTANPMKPGASIGETRQPFPVAPDGDHRRQPPAGQIGQIRAPRSLPAGSGARFRRQSLAIPETRRPRNCQTREHGQPRASRSLPAGIGAGFRWHSLAIPAAGRPKHCQARDHGQPMKPSASIGESRQPLPVAPDGDHRRQPPAGQIGQTRRLDRHLPAAAPGQPLALARDPGNPPAKALPTTGPRPTP